MVKKVRKLQKFDFKYRKALLDLELLQSCKKEKLISKFLQFELANKWLESSEAYLSCQKRLLNQEISIKYRTARTLYTKITFTKNSLHSEMSFTNMHVVTKFLVLNDKSISKIRKNQVKKLLNLYLDKSYHNCVLHLTIEIR